MTLVELIKILKEIHDREGDIEVFLYPLTAISKSDISTTKIKENNKESTVLNIG
jgi:hypothetical protein